MIRLIDDNGDRCTCYEYQMVNYAAAVDRFDGLISMAWVGNDIPCNRDGLHRRIYGDAIAVETVQIDLGMLLITTVNWKPGRQRTVN